MNRQEAINIVKKNWPDSSFTSLREALEFLIPELMNTDNEKIKEAIIKGIIHAAEEGCFCADNYSVKECVAWLEKQGEQDMIPLDKVIKFLDDQLVNDKDEVTGQSFINFKNYGAFKETFISYFKRKMLEKPSEKKLVDKVVPKYNVGDWIVYDGWTTQIKEVYEDGYSNIHQGFIPKKREEEMHLWTIQDAKDGDVLTDGNSFVIFKSNNYDPNTQNGCMVVYCSIMKINESWQEFWYESGGHNPTYYFPATKEQSDFLFAKMKEADYKWKNYRYV